MNNIIIHISDLHVSLHEDLKGNRKEINSWLSTDTTSSTSDTFIMQFILFINKKYYNNNKYIIITGDISNESDETEYVFSATYINKILKELNIPNNNILLIPGDHDINRDANKIAYRDGKATSPNKKSYEYNSEKYEYFSRFYEKVTTRAFPNDKTIVDFLVIENIILIGLNSNYYIDYEGGSGGFNIINMRSEIEQLIVKYPHHLKVAVFHHNITSSFENKAVGQWDLNNRKEVIAAFESLDIKCIFSGNEHTRGTTRVSNFIDISDAGAFTSIKQQASFKCYELVIGEEQIKFINNVFTIQNRNAIADLPFGMWGTQTASEIGESKEFILWQKPNKEILKEDNILDDVFSDNITTSIERKKNLISYQNSIFSQKLYDIIKQKKLLHSGHFHWSDTSRAHNWIDISKILEDKDDLLFVKRAIIDVVQTCGLEDKFDFVLGLGTEGNMISTRLAIMYGKDYSYLPYSYRYEDHNEFEQKLNFSNDGVYKNILVITDVVNDGRTIRKLIGKREKDFFKDVENIIVISLIYTGNESEINHNILNHNPSKNFDVINDEIVNNIDFYSVLNLKVDKCPYTNDNWKDCLIYKDKLDCVHLFYNENKVR